MYTAPGRMHDAVTHQQRFLFPFMRAQTKINVQLGEYHCLSYCFKKSTEHVSKFMQNQYNSRNHVRKYWFNSD